MPDFRAEEKAFARLLQVAGRSGRADRPGEVLIQTYYPDHETIRNAADQDYETFYNREIASREALGYPPFSHMLRLLVSAVDDTAASQAASELARAFKGRINKAGLKVRLLGPAPCPLHRLRGRYRRHMFAMTRQVVKLVRMLTEWEEEQPRFGVMSRARVTVDVDPDDMM
jgi:primosomal protein N' (replication factor Y)